MACAFTEAFLNKCCQTTKESKRSADTCMCNLPAASCTMLEVALLRFSLVGWTLWRYYRCKVTCSKYRACRLHYTYCESEHISILWHHICFTLSWRKHGFVINVHFSHSYMFHYTFGRKIRQSNYFLRRRKYFALNSMIWQNPGKLKLKYVIV